MPLSSRRSFLGLTAAFGSVLSACRTKPVEPRALGAPVGPYGSRSRFERAMRFITRTAVPEESSSKTPLHESVGIITPSSLHFERHHGGVPDLDPATHTLTIHGMVDRPLVFTVEELKRLPSMSRIMFLECSGNGKSEWKVTGEPTVQRTNGLARRR